MPGAFRHTPRRRVIQYAATFAIGSRWRVPALATFATMFPLWNERTETSVPRNAQCVQLSAAAALNRIKNHDAGRERHER
jgi:hypothetical protein